MIKTFRTSFPKAGDAGPLLLPSRKSNPRQNAFERMGEENPGTNQTHRRCNHLEHCSRPLRPRARTPNDVHAYTVKKISHCNGTMPKRWGFGATGVPNPGNRCLRVASVAQKQRLDNHRKPHPISAAFRLRYLQGLMRRWAASNATCNAAWPERRAEAGGLPVGW